MDMFSSDSLFLFCQCQVILLQPVNFISSLQKYLIVLGIGYLCLTHHNVGISFEDLV